jgi:hypothetical protein
MADHADADLQEALEIFEHVARGEGLL